MYTQEKNAQIIISLLKAHGIKNIIASPGTTNVAFIGSIQNDPFFRVYSAVDERSAAYMACGLAKETREPVVLSCTGATASRNYLPGLTEAYYSKLPVLAITSMQSVSKVGHLVAQVIDRSQVQNDVVKLSLELPIVKDKADLWDCEIKVNRAILELERDGGGPVHLNLQTTYTLPFDVKKIPDYRVIKRIRTKDEFPILSGKVAIFIGSHREFNDEETAIIDQFCLSNNAVVFCDHTSGYSGSFRVNFSLVAAQDNMNRSIFIPDVMIHIGEVSGDYPSLRLAGKRIWRVSSDGEIRDTFNKLQYVFDMEESSFFERYISDSKSDKSYLESCINTLENIRENISELPYSNLWVAKQLHNKIPHNSTLHFGILNSLRCWNFFDLHPSIKSSCNVGGFGIDGVLSTIFGASLANRDRLYFCVLGDLAFFYDMNSIGNKHVGSNLRILIVNNGKGTEFRQYNHHAAYFKDDADELIAASTHFGNKSLTLVKGYAESLGFEYISASNKEQFNSIYERFVNTELNNKSIVFEVFTDSVDESEALELTHTIVKDKSVKLKNSVKKLVGSNGMNFVRKVLRS
ncbi:thiamine pyrophosphate-binding protein [Vibrio alginolyticus]|uniref:thiamine pyrophosphate-binding protein n=1 Tax=Vibrio chagasii TaxID=170679 RepID=UPI001EFDEA38|nr:thiamine pyrophosphate-binding protein [Vibrio chagasii]MCG9606872.1 hypothetical protein [Vibrio chagasii]MDE9382887.1 thiamine pyrophosphate-binding protein [Vibrio alginolyticus]